MIGEVQCLNLFWLNHSQYVDHRIDLRPEHRFRDAADESYVTQGSYSDGDAELYLNSLSSQAGAFGFGTPMHAQGRRAFR